MFSLLRCFRVVEALYQSHADLEIKENQKHDKGPGSGAALRLFDPPEVLKVQRVEASECTQY